MKLLIYYLKFILSFVFATIIAGTSEVLSQQIVDDPAQNVEILNYTRRLTFKKLDDSTQLTIIAGSVKLRQGNSLLYCDSCVINDRTNVFEAWGNVHINDADTTNIYSKHLLYQMRTKQAYLDGGVKLTDGHGTLTTPDLEYNMQTNIGIYTNGGKVINKKTTLTSKEGWYFADMKDIYFKKNVVLKDPAYTIVTDSLIYNTETQTTRFIAMTTITDSSGRVIKTREGYYNQQTGKAEFGQRPTIVDGTTEITANRIEFNDSTGISVAEGNAVIVDKKNETTIVAGIIYRNKKTDAILATRKPLMIIKQENDSIYITADTLFSARLSDLYRSQAARAAAEAAMNDSTNVESGQDSLTKNIADSLAVSRIKDPFSVRKLDSLVELTIKDSSAAKTIDSLAELSKKDSLSVNKMDSLVTLTRKDSALGQTRDSVFNVAAKDTSRFIKRDSLAIFRDKDSLVTDTIKGIKLITLNEKDSTNRYFEGYRNVRIFSDSLQAIGDSLFYSFKDSVFRLYQDPVVWAKGSQITGDTILLFTKNKKADRIKAFENSFLVNKLETEAFNQIKATSMDGYFKNGDIDSVRAKGFAESIYYIQDEDSAYTGINESKSDIMDIYFRNKELSRVVMRSAVTGTLWPIRQKGPLEMRLKNFRWLDDRRPKTRFELYE